MLGHALLLETDAGLETLNEVDKIFGGAVAPALNLLQGGFEETIGHVIPGKEF